MNKFLVDKTLDKPIFANNVVNGIYQIRTGGHYYSGKSSWKVLLIV